jgi:lysophospholipase L1-like esterase
MQETLLKKPQTEHPELARRRPWWQMGTVALGLATCQLAACLCLGILGLEAFFNFAGIGNEEFLEPDSTQGVRHIAGKKVVWRLEGFSDEYLSCQGLRDTEHSLAKPAGTYRIALLGDSAVEGMQVALKDTFGKKLESLLNASGKLAGRVEVINFACSSFSNGQETIQLERQVKAWQPDLTIMMYNRGDYLENIRDPNTMNAEPRPYFRLDDAGRLVQDSTILEFNREAFKPHPVLDFLRRNSRVYGVLTHMNLALSLNEPLYTKTRNSIMKLLPQTRNQWKHVTAPYVIHDPWKVTEAIITRASNDCSAMKSKFMLVCFSNNVLDREYARQIEALGKLSRQEGFMYLDLTPAVIYHKNPKSLFLKYHYSAAGHALAAEKIAEAIQ